MADEVTASEDAGGKDVSEAPDTTTDKAAAAAPDSPENGDTSKAETETQDNAEGPAFEIQLTAPDGADQFAPAFESFNEHMNTWFKENPDADRGAILKEAANFQLRSVQKANEDAVKAAEATATQWLADAKADDVIGGDKFDENVGLARTAIEAFGDSDLKTILDETGMGNHPAVIRAFFKAGKSLKEADVSRGAPVSPDQSRESILYPDMKGA